MTAPPEEKVVPFLVAIESPEDGGSGFGGGAFGGYEGEAFFAGSALNKFEPSVATQSITWNQPINVAGKDHLKLTVAVAATFLDFETSDFLNFYIDEGNSPLISFSAPSGNDKFLVYKFFSNILKRVSDNKINLHQTKRRYVLVD